MKVIVPPAASALSSAASMQLLGTPLPTIAQARLADNGGPTQTIAVQAGSPAINAGGRPGCARVRRRDQRNAGATLCLQQDERSDEMSPLKRCQSHTHVRN